MTYDRMKAKVIPSQHCRFCGNDAVPLVKTRCCEQWICCDTAFMSVRGGDYCQFEHEHNSICHFHHNEKHPGSWQVCEECRRFFGDASFNQGLTDPINIPRF